MPLAPDDATFNIPNTYTVTFSGTPTNSVALFGDGNVTFALSGQTYTISNNLMVGNVAGETARLTLLNGTVNSLSTIVGILVGHSGSLTVSSNATANNTNAITIGSFGTGTLTIQNGGDVTAGTTVSVGNTAAGLGTLIVTGDDSRLTSGDALILGLSGEGLMTVSAGGEVTNLSARLGQGPGSDGNATVTGASSRWTMSGPLTVGDDGEGELSIASGGFVQSGVSSIANQNDGVGEVSVSGANSLWKTSLLFVGNVGDGVLSISSGGRVESGGATLGNTAGGSGAATVTGANSRWSLGSVLTIGNASNGTLSVLSGGNLIGVGNWNLGVNAGGEGRLDTDGAGSLASTSGNLIIGGAGKGIVNVTNGGTLSLTGAASRIEVANNAASGNLSSLVITGAGSTVTAPGGVFVAGSSVAAGNTGEIFVGAGATLNAANGTVKIWPVPMSQLAIHNGTIHARNFERLGSFDFRDGLLHIDGGILTNGAAATPLTLNGFDADDLPTLRFSNNANSTLISDVTIGDTRRGRLEVLSGAFIAPSGDVVLGKAVGSTGTVLVSGENTSFGSASDVLNVGQTGAGTIDVVDRAFLSSGLTNIGRDGQGSGVVNIDNADWNVFDALNVGNAGPGTLNIRDGGFVASDSATVGVAGGSNNFVNVAGENSRWQSGPIVVANAGRAMMSISDGGELLSGNATLASAPGSFATVNLQGAGSQWGVGGALRVGVSGIGATLNVLDRAVLTSAQATIAETGGGNFGNTTISGAGSVWTNGGGLFVGGTSSSAGGSGALIVGNGATLNTGTAIDDKLKIWDFSTLTLDGGTINARRFEQRGAFTFNDGLLSVSGGLFNPTFFGAPAPLLLNGANSGDIPTLRLSAGATTSGITSLTVGNTRSAALELSGGAQLGSTEGNIATQPGSTGRVALDSGAIWNLSGSLNVGGTTATAGGSGTLSVGNGALVNAQTGIVRLRTDGVINLDGGTIAMEAFQALGGQFNFNAGTVQFVGGATLSDTLLTTLLGASHSLSTGRNLTGGSLLVAAPLAIDGGSLSPATLTVGSVLQIHSGSATTVSTATVQPFGLVRLASTGLLDVGGTLTNHGLIELAADTATLDAINITNNGILSGRGRVIASLSNNASGSIRAENGARLRFLGQSANNTGRIETLSGGTIEFQQGLNNNANGLITGRDGVLRFNGGLTNSGGMGFTVGVVDVFGDVTNNAAGGQVTVSGRGLVNFYDDVVNNGVIQVSNGSTAVYFGAVTGTGSFPGTGTNFFEGDLRPGASPSIVNFGGDVEFGASSSLEIELGGLSPGTQHDRINVGGQARLNGVLDLELINGFVPTAGDSFTIMTFGSRVGTFPSVSGTAINPNLQLAPVYSATDLRLITTSATEKTWGVDADGLFSAGSNWVGGVAPTGTNESVAFTTAISADRTVDVDIAASLVSARFDDNNNYTLAGVGPIRFQAAGPAVANLIVQNTHGNGAHTINAPIETLGDLVITQDSTQPLTIGGPLDAAPGRAITKAGDGTLVANRVRASALSVNAGVVVIAPNGGDAGTSVIDILSVTAASRLNLNNNDLVVRATAATKDAVHGEIEADIVSAQNGLDAALITKWDGPGITSSAARTANQAAGFDLVGLGVIRNSDLDITTGLPGSTYSMFSGQPVTPDDVLVKYTYIGDANLSGAVSFDDYVGIDNAFFGLIPNLGWATGDINFDNVINFDDYSKIDQAFFFQGAPLTSESGTIAVPEPTAWLSTLIGLLSIAFIYGRGRSSHFRTSLIKLPQ